MKVHFGRKITDAPIDFANGVDELLRTMAQGWKQTSSIRKYALCHSRIKYVQRDK